MTVQELITQLQQLDPNMEVRVKGVDPTDWEYQNKIEGIEIGRSNWEEELIETEWDDDGDPINWDGKELVLIDAGMF